VKFTQRAAEQLIKIMERDGLDPSSTAIRMGVKGGGCSGFTYTLDFTSKVTKRDLTYSSFDVIIVVDKKSHLYIGQTTIDWSNDLQDRGLKFDNPFAKGSCGCKTSFMIDIEQTKKPDSKPSWMNE
jgi:iron-sulfur cluster assembly protein|tara:strand:+ start:658 stop:1035 length:378 start_codon:yes stop_codon:yes gene_type:complete